MNEVGGGAAGFSERKRGAQGSAPRRISVVCGDTAGISAEDLTSVLETSVATELRKDKLRGANDVSRLERGRPMCRLLQESQQ